MIQNNFSSMTANDFSEYCISEKRSKVLGQLYSSLKINPISAIHYHCKPTWQLKQRKLQNSYWTFLIRGNGKVLIEDIEYQVKPGDIILFPEGTNHSFTHNESDQLEMINVHFHAKIYGLIDFLKIIDLSGVFYDSAGLTNPISHELARLHALKPSCSKEQMTQLIRALLLHSAYYLKKTDDIDITEMKKMLKIFPALEMINKRLGDSKLKQSNLASALCISEVYLRRLFNELFNESPVKFINHRRIENACEMLKQSTLSVKTIADKTGFNDLQFFYRVFGRITGTTPAKYRSHIEDF